MTDDEINQAIAEACGWTDFLVHPEFGLMGVEPDTHGLRTAVLWYVCDLNAMHEAEQRLTKEQAEDYIARLFDSCYESTFATARQRAEAFLRTLGKWEEGK